MNSRKGLILLLAIYIIASLIYSFSSHSTWDDDCPTRYYNTRISLSDPTQFLSIWNRPLFVLIFALPVQFGAGAIPVLMIIIAAFSTYYLYKALEFQQIKNAYLIVPLLLFQTFYFSISRNAETEQLAVAIFCFGYYFMVHKKWFLFALILGLLPLARLELVLMLPFSALILIKNKQFKLIFLMGLPILLWHIAGVIITGDVGYLYNETLGGENKTNRYGHTSFGHYFERYIYFVGPIIFFFLLFGIVKALFSKLKYDLYIFLQFLAGFFIYVVFSWKLNMGNAAGFMRNLAPVSAHAAVIALWGYNFWLTILSDKKSKIVRDEQPIFEELSKSAFNKLSKNEKLIYRASEKKFMNQRAKQKEETKAAIRRQARKRIFNRIGMVVFVLVLVLISWTYFQYELRSHHKFGNKVDYHLNFLVIGGLSFISLFFLFFPIKSKIIDIALASIVVLTMLSFTLVTEPPNMNQNEERSIMDEVSDLFVNHPEFEKVHVNHIWFFWANDLDREDEKYKPVTMAELDSADAGAYCIWESHYSHRLSGDVQTDYFKSHPEWVRLTYFTGKQHNFNCVLYVKVEDPIEDKLRVIKEFSNSCDDNLEAKLCLAQAWGEIPSGNDSALFYFDYAAKLDSANLEILFYRGMHKFSRKEFEKAESDFIKCVTLKPNWVVAWVNLGAVYSNQTNYDSALTCYNYALKANPKEETALLNRGKTYLNMRDTANAMNDLAKLINLKPSHHEAYDIRAKIFFAQQQWDKVIADINKKIAINPNDPVDWLIIGISYFNSGKKEEARSAFENSSKLGNENATLYLQRYFPQS